MVEKGQPAGITGQLQSIQWAAMYAATILTGTVGGFLSQHGFEREGFLICAGATLLTLVLAVFWIKEPRVERRESFREVIAELLMALRMPAIWLVASFLFLWNFNPFSTTVLYMHMTERMRFTEQFYGHSVSLMAGAAVVACVAYGGYCRRVPFGLLIHASIVLGILSTLAYWFLGGTISAVVISLAVGFVYMTSTLIQFDLAARVCPPHAAGTIFATLMALTNLSVSASTWIGGKMYAYGETRWGSDVAFHALVGIGAAFTAICWILVPGLRRHNREITHEAD